MPLKTRRAWLLIGLPLVLLGFATQAQERLDAASTAVLSGQPSVFQAGQLPRSIVLPREWLGEFRAISQRANAIELEVGACLSVVAADARHSCISTSDTNASSACDEPQWIVGRVFTGHPMSIDLSVRQCTGTEVGDVHAHPRSSGPFFTYYLPSDSDIIRRLTSDSGRLSAVINDAGACVIVNSNRQQVASLSARTALSEHIYGQLFVALLSGETSADAAPVDVDHFETSWAGQAYTDRVGRVIAGSVGPDGNGGALYCGGYDQPLSRRMEPANEAARRMTSPIARIAAKATVIVARWLYYPRWPVIDFAWLDSQDPTFERYVEQVVRQGEPVLLSAGVRPQEAKRMGEASAGALLQQLWPILKDAETGRPPALNFWGFRAPRESRGGLVARRRVVFFVGMTPQGWRYEIDASEGPDQPWRPIARSSPGHDEWSLVQRAGDGYRLSERTATYRYDGEVVPDGGGEARGGRAGWTRTGHGVLISGSTRYEGQFLDGQMHGRGTMDGAQYRYEGQFDHNRPAGPGRLFVKATQTWHVVQGNAVVPSLDPADVPDSPTGR